MKYIILLLSSNLLATFVCFDSNQKIDNSCQCRKSKSCGKNIGPKEASGKRDYLREISLLAAYNGLKEKGTTAEVNKMNKSLNKELDREIPLKLINSYFSKLAVREFNDDMKLYMKLGPKRYLKKKISHLSLNKRMAIENKMAGLMPRINKKSVLPRHVKKTKAGNIVLVKPSPKKQVIAKELAKSPKKINKKIKLAEYAISTIHSKKNKSLFSYISSRYIKSFKRMNISF